MFQLSCIGALNRTIALHGSPYLCTGGRGSCGWGRVGGSCGVAIREADRGAKHHPVGALVVYVVVVSVCDGEDICWWITTYKGQSAGRGSWTGKWLPPSLPSPSPTRPRPPVGFHSQPRSRSCRPQLINFLSRLPPHLSRPRPSSSLVDAHGPAGRPAAANSRRGESGPYVTASRTRGGHGGGVALFYAAQQESWDRRPAAGVEKSATQFVHIIHV